MKSRKDERAREVRCGNQNSTLRKERPSWPNTYVPLRCCTSPSSFLRARARNPRPALPVTGKARFWGVAKGFLVSVDQEGAEVPIDAIVQNGSHLKLIAQAVAGTFEGDLKDGQLAGTWMQGPKYLAAYVQASGGTTVNFISRPGTDAIALPEADGQ